MPGLLTRLTQAAGVAFGYHAVVDKKRRTAPSNASRSEDRELNASQRRTMVATARDAQRNFALVGWMLRRHVSYVADHTFQATTSDPALNTRLENLMRWWSRAENCDYLGRHPLSRLRRLWAAHKAIDGDIGINYRRPLGQLLTIEGDRIAKPTTGLPPAISRLYAGTGEDIPQHGIILDSQGRNARYIICRRRDTSLIYDTTARARDMHLLAHYTRIDSVRGVSRLAAALNWLADIYEIEEYTNTRIKLLSMVGWAVEGEERTSDEREGFEVVDANTGAAPTADTTAYEFQPKPGFIYEGTGKINPVEFSQPSEQTVNYLNFLTHVCLLVLDLPMTFFDSNKGSYIVHRHDAIQYASSVKPDQEDMRGALDWATTRKVNQWAANPDMLPLPKGMLPRDITWEWIPNGVPLLDIGSEIAAYGNAISLGLMSRKHVANTLGLPPPSRTFAELEQEEKDIVDRGITIQIGQPGAVTTRDEETANPANEPTNATKK